jgi:hypothetical protein
MENLIRDSPGRPTEREGNHTRIRLDVSVLVHDYSSDDFRDAEFKECIEIVIQQLMNLEPAAIP